MQQQGAARNRTADVCLTSTMGAARGSTQGSWRPFPLIVVSSPSLVTVFWSCPMVDVGLKAWSRQGEGAREKKKKKKVGQTRATTWNSRHVYIMPLALNILRSLWLLLFFVQRTTGWEGGGCNTTAIFRGPRRSAVFFRDKSETKKEEPPTGSAWGSMRRTTK